MVTAIEVRRGDILLLLDKVTSKRHIMQECTYSLPDSLPLLQGDRFDEMVSHEEEIRLGDEGWKGRYYKVTNP